MVRPLQEMVKNYKPRQPVKWTAETLKVFQDVKNAINACPKLYFLDDHSPIYLHTDASDYGVGGYLFQIVNGVEHPIVFLSNTFKQEQKNWSAADKECYAIIWSFKHLEHYIRDRYFILGTDHKNLTYLNLENSGKVRRWKLLVQEYNCGVEHIIGSDNFVADDFSRLIPHIRKSGNNEVSESLEVISTAETAPPHPMVESPAGKIANDDAISPYVPVFERGSNALTSTQDKNIPVYIQDCNKIPVEIQDPNITVYTQDTNKIPVEIQDPIIPVYIQDNITPVQIQDIGINTIPEGVDMDLLNPDVLAPLIQVTVPRDKYKLISAVHNSIVGHMGVDKTLERLNEQGHEWPNMREHVITFISKHCACCQKMSIQKILTNTKPFTLSSYDVMQRIAVDSTGRLPMDAHGNQFIISIIDHFSRFVELYAVPDLSAATFARCLLSWMGRYHPPTQLVSDKGTQFANEIIKELCKMVGTEQIFTMRASKQENGIVERSIKEIRRHLRAIIFHTNLMDNWSTYIPLVQRIFNADVKEALGVSPAQIIFGNSIHLDRGIFLDQVPNQTATLSEWMEKMLKAQRDIIAMARRVLNKRDEHHMSQTHGEPTTYPVNSYVLADYRVQPPTTLHTHREGPFRVAVSSANGHYVLENLVTGELQDYHVSQLHPFYYDNEDVPRQTAMRDTQQWDVESIITHAGDPSHRKEMKFRVRWLGYDETHDTWEPWDHLRHNAKLHEYLRANKMKRLIPKTDK